MKTFTLAITALTFATVAATSAFAGSDEHFGLNEQLAIARGQTYAAPVVEGRQSVALPASGSDQLVLWLNTDRDMNSKR